MLLKRRKAILVSQSEKTCVQLFLWKYMKTYTNPYINKNMSKPQNMQNKFYAHNTYVYNIHK